MGLIVGIVILCAYAFVLFRIIQISRRASNLRGSLICYGVFAYLLTHIIVNLFGVMGMIPLTGVPLPFLSYGGSYTICLMIAMGLVQRVAGRMMELPKFAATVIAKGKKYKQD